MKTAQKIRIDHCSATGEKYSNLLPGTEHERLETPAGRSEREVWVMGVGEPVLLTFWEYDLITKD